MPRYDFKCTECETIQELSIKLANYKTISEALRCEKCGAEMKRMMDYKGSFELKGAGWYGSEGTGTGYEITQNEMDKNGDDNRFLEDRMS